MRRRLSYGAWLLAVWVALWEDLTVANLVSGVAVVIVLLAAFPLRHDRRMVRPRPLPMARFVAYFLWKLVEASAIVAWEIVTPRNRVNEGIVAVPIRGISDGVTTLVANAISLVPGTLTLDVRTDPVVLYVHVLHLRDVEAVRREVLHLEALATLALGPASVLDAVASGRRGVETVGPEGTSETMTGDRSRRESA